MNSRSGGNTGKARVETLKREWKSSLDLELKERLGVVVSQGAAFAKPALTLADGRHVPALNRESRRLLDKHLSFRVSEPTASGACKTRNFRWTHFDATIFELASAKGGRGWNTGDFRVLFPELVGRLKTYEGRVETLKRVGYLTAEGRVTEEFRLHYSVHKGEDQPELQGIRADLYTRAFGKRQIAWATTGCGAGGWRGGAGCGANGWSSGGCGAVGQECRGRRRCPGRGDSLGRGAAEVSPGAGAVALSVTGGGGADRDAALWDTLQGDRRLLGRLERLGVSPAHLRRVHEEAQRRLPTAETLRQLRQTIGVSGEVGSVSPPAVTRPGIIRAYCAVQGAKVVSFFQISKEVLTLRPGRHAALARRMLEQARRDYFFAKERRLAIVARRLRPILFLGRIVAPVDVERLELALHRVGELPARETAEPFLQGVSEVAVPELLRKARGAAARRGAGRGARGRIGE